MVQIKYIRSGSLTIPRLKSRPMGVNLPLMDYRSGKPLPPHEQILHVEEYEANDLIRQGHFELVEEKKSKKKTEVEMKESEE